MKISRFLSLCFLFSVCLTGCKNDKTDTVVDSRDPNIVQVYAEYQNSGGTLSYDEWLSSIRGADGSTILSGVTTPDISLGKNGDVYINTQSWDLFTKVGGSWSKIGNLIGPKGEKGDDGVSVVSIAKTSSDGLVDTYTITYSNNTTSTFTVTNGAPGQSIQGEPGQDGHTPVITISDDGYWVIDNVKTTTQAQGQQGNPAPYDEQGLDFYPLDDGTYAVGIGNAIYLSTIIVPETFNGKTVSTIGKFNERESDSFDNYIDRHISFPNTIREIKNDAFDGLYGNTTLEFNMTYSQFKTIRFGEYCFSEYKNLKFDFLDVTIEGSAVFDCLVAHGLKESYVFESEDSFSIGFGINSGGYADLPSEIIPYINISIENPSVVSIRRSDYEGSCFNISALYPGTTNVTFSLGDLSATYTITVDFTSSFSAALQSGSKTLFVGSNDYVKIYGNSDEFSEKSYIFETYPKSYYNELGIDETGKVTGLYPGTYSIIVTEKNSGESVTIDNIKVIENYNAGSGAYDFSYNTSLEDRAQIIGQLEKYAMDTHIAGIPLCDNGYYLKFSDRVSMPDMDIPREGFDYKRVYGVSLSGSLPGYEGQIYPNHFHDSLTQDTLSINSYNSTGDSVKNLSNLITSSYWDEFYDRYGSEWCPSLAQNSIKAPLFDIDGNVVSYGETKYNSAPVPAEVSNSNNLYKKWRIYLKTDDTFSQGLKYKTASAALSYFNNKGVTIDDYQFVYQMLLTGSNNLIRGAELVSDLTFGIKGAKEYYEATRNLTNDVEIQNKWDELVNNGKLGIKTGFDEYNDSYYLDIELNRPTDAFNVMYKFSDHLFSPLPRELFIGSHAIASSMKDAVSVYGSFNYGSDDKILDYTLCLGSYTLSKWDKNSQIVFDTNMDWHDRLNDMAGIYYRIIDISMDSEKIWKQFNNGNLDCTKIPNSKINEETGKPSVFRIKGSETMKLNVNSCTQEMWNERFGPNGTVSPNSNWDVKPWMSNNAFLDGLFYSINRTEFANKYGGAPTTNFFSDLYQIRSESECCSYNDTIAHRNAVSDWSENYGFNIEKAIHSFRIAVNQLVSQNLLALGTKENPTEIHLDIVWMYQTDRWQYGSLIKKYFESTFNCDAVCDGKVKLVVDLSSVTNWEDIYTEKIMKGQFDLAFASISGNKYNPLNFMEVLKSDNSSAFTLNWGPDISVIDDNHPIIYYNRKWSFDALWAAADHGCVVENGMVNKISPHYEIGRPTVLGGSQYQNKLYEGFDIEIYLDFGSVENYANIYIDRLDCYIYGYKNITLGEEDFFNKIYDRTTHTLKVSVSLEKAQEINEAIKVVNGFDGHVYSGDDEWKNNPFIIQKYGDLFNFELYYSISINGASTMQYLSLDTFVANN